MLQLSWKFGEPKFNPYCVNELIWHYLCPKRAWRCCPIWLICNTLWDNAMLKLSCKFGETKWNLCWLIISTSSSGTNYILNEHEDVDEYGSFATPSEIVLYQSHPESLVNQNEILIELSCYQAHLAQIMSLTYMKLLTNMTHMQYQTNWCYVKAILKGWWI